MKKMLCCMAMALLLAGCGPDRSVGVIGGADGPTAIFISGGSSGETPPAQPGA